MTFSILVIRKSSSDLSKVSLFLVLLCVLLFLASILLSFLKGG